MQSLSNLTPPVSPHHLEARNNSKHIASSVKVKIIALYCLGSVRHNQQQTWTGGLQMGSAAASTPKCFSTCSTNLQSRGASMLDTQYDSQQSLTESSSSPAAEIFKFNRNLHCTSIGQWSTADYDLTNRCPAAQAEWRV